MKTTLQDYLFHEEGHDCGELAGYLAKGWRIHTIHQRSTKYAEFGETYTRITYDYHLVRDV